MRGATSMYRVSVYSSLTFKEFFLLFWDCKLKKHFVFLLAQNILTAPADNTCIMFFVYERKLLCIIHQPNSQVRSL